jgi:hypothetical protein
MRYLFREKTKRNKCSFSSAGGYNTAGGIWIANAAKGQPFGLGGSVVNVHGEDELPL